MANVNAEKFKDIKYDGFITIATAKNRRAKQWKNQRGTWSKLLSRLSKTIYTRERQSEYMAMPKDRQDSIKDVGGFVGGELKDGRRLAENVVNRQLVVLDADFAPLDLWDEVTMYFSFACCMYSTHKHSKDNPRYRLVVPLDRSVDPDEYQAISRKLADLINIEYFDDTTYQPHRLMYWPSTSADAEYVFEYNDSSWLHADDVLNEYDDWKDQSSWAVSSRSQKAVVHAMKKQQDPTEKEGLVGAFCRVYDIDSAIEKFLPEVYVPCGVPNRYTYALGSSSGGAVVYEDKWLYSHHATDPTSMQLCNSFDLVRLHKFGELDAKAKIADTTRLPSYVEMCKLASSDKEVKLAITKERMESAGRDFSVIEDTEVDLEWTEKLQTSAKTGEIMATRYNIDLIMRNDPDIKGVFGFELFSQRVAIRRDPRWKRNSEGGTYWNDTDDANLRVLIENSYNIDNKPKIDDCLLTVAADNSFHVVRDMLTSLEWDGVPRVDTLFIDFLGAEDTPYVRAVCRKFLAAAVARVMEPGIKYDTMPVLVGRQGVGKSYLLKKLGGKWFSDSITTLQGKEAYEQLRGVWIEEFSELSAMRKADIEIIKQYISKQVDTYRPAYGRTLMDFPRQCVFAGTTNTENFLRDKTGNRRFLPIKVGVAEPTKSLFAEGIGDYIKQVWAEAVQIYRSGEVLVLEGENLDTAKELQEEHMEENPLQGQLEEYLNMEVPGNWYELDLRSRRNYVQGDGFELDLSGAFVRDKICTLEVWCELLGGSPKDFTSYNSREIGETLDTVHSWKRSGKVLRFGKLIGVQKAWVRKRISLIDRVKRNKQKETDEE